MGFAGGGGGSSAALAALTTLVNNHIAASTNVHGIANMANLMRAFGGARELVTANGNWTGAKVLDFSAANIQTATLTGNVTLSSIANTGITMDASHFFAGLFVATQDGTGNRTLTWPGSVTWLTGSPRPTLTAAAVATYYLYTLDGGTTWLGSQLSGIKSLGGAYSAQPGAVTSFTIAHGLGATPTSWWATPQDTDSQTAPDMYVTADGTNLTLNFAAALNAATTYQWVWGVIA